ncbi:hypothetical protein MHYP_G00038100 [Metynnis hypsauchen]
MSPAPALFQTISHQDLWLSRGRTTPDSSHRNYLYLSLRFLLSDCTNYIFLLQFDERIERYHFSANQHGCLCGKGRP